MAFIAKTGSFALTTATAGSTQQITGVGFTPKVLIFQINGQTSGTTQATITTSRRSCFGVALSTSDRRVYACSSDTGVTPTVANSGHRTDGCLATVASGGGWEGLIDLQSLDADGFTLVVSTAFATAYQVFFIALAGDELISGKSNHYQQGGTGNQSYTGIGFKPDIILLFGGAIALTTPATANTTAGGDFCFGAATPTESWWTYAADNNGAATSVSVNASNQGAVFNFPGGANSTGLGRQATLVSMNSDGFTLNWSNTQLSQSFFHCLAIKGGNWDLGAYLQTITLNGISVVTGSIKNTGGLFWSGGNSVNQPTTTQTFEQVIGFVDFSLNQFSMSHKSVNGHNPSLDALGIGFGFDLYKVEQNGTVGIGAVMQSMDPSGFTNKTTISGQAQGVWTYFILFGSTSGLTLTPASVINISKKPPFSVKKSMMLDAVDFPVFVPPPVAPTFVPDLDADLNYPQPMWLLDREISDTGVERIQLPFLPPFDHDADHQKLHPDWVKDHLSDEEVEKITLPPTVAFLNFWDADAEQQFQWTPPFGDDTLSDEGVEKIFIPTVAYDFEQQQLLWIPPFGEDTLADEGVELITLPFLPPFDHDADHQIPTPPFMTDRDVMDAGVELIQYAAGIIRDWEGNLFDQIPFLPYTIDEDVVDPSVEKITLAPGVTTGWDHDADHQKLFPDWIKDHLSDEAVEKITLPPTVSVLFFWDNDADYQKLQIPPFGQDTLADEGVEIILYGAGVIEGWTDIQEQQKLFPDVYRDHLADEGVEKITVPTVPLDTDADFNKPTPGYQYDDAHLDYNVELITLPSLPPFNHDADYQLLWLPPFGDDTLADENVELVQYANGVLSGWVLDSEQQLAQPGYQVDRDVMDPVVELIQYGAGVLEGWPADYDQLAQIPSFGQDDVADSGVELIILPPFDPKNLPHDEDFAIAFGTQVRDQVPDDPNKIIVPLAWDDDQELGTFFRATDHLSDEAVEKITLAPFPPYLTDADQQKQWIPPFGQDTLSDEGVELITLTMSFFDTDADQQREWAPQFRMDDQERRESTNFIILPFNDWTLLDEWQHQWIPPFGQDHLSDEGVEHIIEKIAVLVLAGGTVAVSFVAGAVVSLLNNASAQLKSLTNAGGAVVDVNKAGGSNSSDPSAGGSLINSSER